jgi:hypothetical protein
MNNNNLPIILFSRSDDPVVQYLRAHGEGIRIFHVDELTPYLNLVEWPGIFEQHYPAEMLEAFTGAHVINRVFSLGGTRLKALFDSWLYHEQWAHLALAPLLDRATELSHDTGIKGASRSLLPLSTQWFLLERAVASVKTPVFAYAFGGAEPDIKEIVSPLQKSVWSLFDWRDEGHISEQERQWHRFVVDRPTGVPVICYFVNSALEEAEDIDFILPRGETEIDRGRFADLAQAVARIFRSELGEFLTYVEEDGALRFHAFSPGLETAAQRGEFSKILGRWVSRLTAG